MNNKNKCYFHFKKYNFILTSKLYLKLLIILFQSHFYWTLNFVISVFINEPNITCYLILIIFIFNNSPNPIKLGHCVMHIVHLHLLSYLEPFSSLLLSFKLCTPVYCIISWFMCEINLQTVYVRDKIAVRDIILIYNIILASALASFFDHYTETG